MNNLSAIILGGAIAAFPIFVLIFYCCKFAKWEDEDFDEKYGAIFEGLRKDTRASLFYPFVFILRRMILVVVTKLTDQNLTLQIMSMILLSFLVIAYLVYYEPFEEKLIH